MEGNQYLLRLQMHVPIDPAAPVPGIYLKIYLHLSTATYLPSYLLSQYIGLKCLKYGFG